MYRTYYSRPGCFGWLAFSLIALCLAGIPKRLVANVSPTAGWVVYVVSVVLIVWGLTALLRVSTSTHRAVCPHCGVDTDPQFRVCRSCGRVKNT